MLVDQDKPTDALVQLTTAHGEAIGNYNLAYLLVQKKNRPAALAHFRKAAEKDPTLTAAVDWVATLENGPRPAAQPSYPAPQTSQPPAMMAQRPVYPDASRSNELVRAGGIDSRSQYPPAATPSKGTSERRLPAVAPTRS